MRILAIETSCDETAASLVDIDEKASFARPLANVISSQIALHRPWGGVVPNLAAREHLKNILPVIETCLKNSGASRDSIDLLAVTQGPGLIPALLIGTTTAKTLAYLWKKPLIGIHHIEGHIYSNFIGKKLDEISFPILCLVVSGGHTQLILMKKHLDYTILGETRDDAVGEAFDKVARILGLEYPGGPVISHLASAFSPPDNPFTVKFPRPMLESADLNFSFSGLKTAVLYHVKKNEALLSDPRFLQKISFEFQQAAIDVLSEKTLKAAYAHQPKTIVLAGGVSANQELQKQLAQKINSCFPETKFLFPATDFQLDNAAMIAVAAFFRYKNTEKKEVLFSSWKNMRTDANLKINFS